MTRGPDCGAIRKASRGLTLTFGASWMLRPVAHDVLECLGSSPRSNGSAIQGEQTVGLSSAGPGDFLALLKPRVMSLVVFTALVGMVMAPELPHPVIGFASLLAIAVGAGASGALNMWYDADIDAIMTRTANRPVPAGRVAPGEALAFGLFPLCRLSVFVLGLCRQLACGRASGLHHLLSMPWSIRCG